MMGQYISLAAAINAVEYAPTSYSDHTTIEDVIEQLNDVPVVDAVEVVRCINCVHFSEKSSMCRKWSKHGTVFTIPSGFCHKGKRRTEERCD